MKSTFKNINKYFLILIVNLFSLSLFAHFGTKGPYGGTITCATTNAGIVYIGTENGGVFETTNDQLVAWRARPVGLKSGKITAITHSGSYLFAGTADSGIYVFNGFQGSDRYWNKINSGLSNLNITSLCAIDSITVIAGTNGGGLFITTNKGATWTAVNDADINSTVVTSIVKAGTKMILLTQSGGAFISNDGNVWNDFNDANTQGKAGSALLSYNNTTDELIVFNSTGLFLATSVGTISSPVYASVNTGLPANTIIRAISNNGTHWFLATDKGVFTSPTGTINWSAVNNGLPTIDVTSIIALPNAIITGVRKEGVYKSATGTIDWKNNNASFNNPVTRTMTAGGDSLIVSVTEKGVYISKNLATSYVLSNNGLTDSLNINDVIIADFCILAATTNGGVFFTADTGKTWMAINNGLANTNIKKLFYANNKKYAIDAAGGVYESLLHSSDWTSIKGNLPTGAMPTSMAFYGNKIIIGTLGSGIFVKEKLSWTAFNTGLGNLNVTSLTASGNKFYAGTDGSGVYITDISAAAWAAVTKPAIGHYSLVNLDPSKILDMASYAGYVYASYKGGLIATADGGNTWLPGGNQFNLPSFTNVYNISFVKSRVFVTTDFNAVYSNSLAELPTLDTFIVASSNIINSPYAGDTNIVTINANYSWTISGNPSWVRINQATGFRDGNIELYTDPNTGAARSAQVVLTSGNKAHTITINQAANTTGVKELAKTLISVYPNPSNGTFNINVPEGAAINGVTISDYTGKSVYNSSYQIQDGVITISSSLAPGVYFITMNAANNVFISKIIIN